MDPYFYKYLKYKTKYLGLFSQIGGKRKYDYYLIHATKFDNMWSILKDGVIYPGKDLDASRRVLSGGEPQDSIYTNIYFEDLENLKIVQMDYNIIFHPKLLYEYDWDINSPSREICGKIRHKLSDTKDVDKKINEIKQFVKNPDLPERVKFGGIFTHEILIKDNIPVRGNVVAIICNYCSEQQINKLKRLINKYKYKIKIYDRIKFPSLKELYIK